MKSNSLKLISAVAAGDAKREDVVAALKAEGIDSLDVLIDVLTSASRGRTKPAPLSILDPKRATRESVKSVHNIPRWPVLLNGTLYDPADIKRFDGQEIHYIGGSANSPIIAIDDRETFDRWRQHAYLTATAAGSSLASRLAAQVDEYDDGAAVSTTLHPTSPSFPGSYGPIYGPVGGTPSPGIGGPPRAIFYEDINYQGSSIETLQNRGFVDLTEVSWTFLGTGDWNDTISSYQTSIPLTVTLWEHVGWRGSSHTGIGSCLNLVDVGFNDLASSTECW